MRNRAILGIIGVVFAGFLFIGVFNVFHDSYQNIQNNIATYTEKSMLAY